MRIKFQGVSASDPESLKHHTDHIENNLKSAQEKASTANHSGHKTMQKLDSLKWIIVTEMLRVLNETTSKAKLEPTDMKRMETVVKVGREKCFKYLQKANEIETITDFVASKIKVEGYQASRKFNFMSTDGTAQLCQLIHVDLQAEEFFRMMEEKYVTASTNEVEECRSQTGERQVGQPLGLVAPSNKASTPLIMGISTLDLISRLEESNGINEGVKKSFVGPQNDLQLVQWRIRALGMIRNLDPESCIKAGLREVANMVHGGTALANSSYWAPRHVFCTGW